MSYLPDEIEIRVAEAAIRISVRQNAAAAGLGLGNTSPSATIGGALGNSELISWKDKIGFLRFIAAGVSQYLRDPLVLDQYSVAEYARKYGVSENVIYTVIWTFSSGLFFLSPERYSAYPFFALTWAGIKGSSSSRLAIFKGGMTDVMADPLARPSKTRRGDPRSSRVEKRLPGRKSCRVIVTVKR